MDHLAAWWFVTTLTAATTVGSRPPKLKIAGSILSFSMFNDVRPPSAIGRTSQHLCSHEGDRLDLRGFFFDFLEVGGCIHRSVPQVHVFVDQLWVQSGVGAGG